LWLPSIGWTAYFISLVAGSLAYVAVDQNVMRLRGVLFRPNYGKILMISAYSLLAIGIITGAIFKLGV
jgi:uncharacterized membrane protein